MAASALLIAARTMVGFTALIPSHQKKRSSAQMHRRSVGRLPPLGCCGATYTGGESGDPVGTPGAPYALHASGFDSDAAAFSADFVLTNQRGLVLEGQSGYVGPGMPGSVTLGNGLSTYEFAEPLLNVESGTIVLGETSYDITGGNLWLDRQVITPPQPATQPAASLPASDVAAVSGALSQSAAVHPLYCGDWMSIKLDDGPTVVLAAFWQPAAPGKKQWITGTVVGLPPLGGRRPRRAVPAPAGGRMRGEHARQLLL